MVVTALPAALVLTRMRAVLLALVVASLVGTGVELVLLEHVEDTAQRIPLALIALGLLVCAWHALAQSRTSVRALQSVMRLSVAAGVLGIGLHYRGNLAFELEMYPTMSGLELLRKVVTGATPVLAPGTMSLIGVIGLLHAYRHPALEPRRIGQQHSVGQEELS
jgi:hypothetical protein